MLPFRTCATSWATIAASSFSSDRYSIMPTLIETMPSAPASAIGIVSFVSWYLNAHSGRPICLHRGPSAIFMLTAT